MQIKTKIRVETFQFIDNLDHIIKPSTVFDCKNGYIEIVKRAFLDAGWEGDGEIGLIWLPPFIDIPGGTTGVYVWHVKQDNNGISFLGFEETECGYSSNEYENKAKYEAVTVTHDSTLGCIRCVDGYRENLKELNNNKDKLSSEIYQLTLKSIHSSLVADFIETIDEIYFDIMLHVIDNENIDKLKLSRSNVKLPLDEISKGAEEPFFNSWLSLRLIESAIWKDFKFWQVKEKIKEVCKAVDFQLDENLKSMINTHIEIRNAFQHHSGQFNLDMKRTLGKEYIELLDEKSRKIQFGLWSKIVLSIPEIYVFCDSIETFMRNYEANIETRMKTRQYKYIKGKNVSSFKPLSIVTDSDMR